MIKSDLFDRAVSFQGLLRLLRSCWCGRGWTWRTLGRVLVTTRCSPCRASTNPTNPQRGLQNVGKSPQERAVRRFQTESLHLHRNLFVAPSHDFEGSDQRFQSGEKDLEISPNGCRKEENGRVLVFSKICHFKDKVPCLPGPWSQFCVSHFVSSTVSSPPRHVFPICWIETKRALGNLAQGCSRRNSSLWFHRLPPAFCRTFLSVSPQKGGYPQSRTYLASVPPAPEPKQRPTDPTVCRPHSIWWSPEISENIRNKQMIECQKVCFHLQRYDKNWQDMNKKWNSDNPQRSRKAQKIWAHMMTPQLHRSADWSYLPSRTCVKQPRNDSLVSGFPKIPNLSAILKHSLRHFYT